MGAQPRGDAREQDAGRVRGNGPVTRPADLGGDVLKERDGLLVVGHEGSPETDVQQIHARQGRRFALGKVKDILEGSAEPVGQPDGIPRSSVVMETPKSFSSLAASLAYWARQ